MSDPGKDAQLSVDVLIVEDSPTQAARLQSQLAGRGAIVRVARDGQQALDLMRKQLPDVVVTDVLMPIMDGYQLCRKINDDAESRHVPVILLTDLRAPEDAIRGLEAGASCFLSKPCNIDELVERIEMLQENVQQLHGARQDFALTFPFAGRQHAVSMDQAQIVNLLLSSFDTVLRHRRRLETANEELSQALRAVESLGHLIVEEQSSPKLTTAASELRILVVEDSPVQAERARMMLAARGFEVRVARDGTKGLAVAREWKPEIVLSDVVMPGMDGYELCEAIKDDRDLSATQVVMLTSLSDPADIVRGINAGADYYLTKPCTDEHLVYRMEGIAAGRVQHPAQPGDRIEAEVNLSGTQHRIRASRKQILDLMLSTYENAVQQNRELQHLKQELEDLNSSLEDRVKQKTAELWQAERKYQSLVDNVGDGIFQLDGDGLVLTANPAFAAMLGYRDVQELLADEDGVSCLIDGGRSVDEDGLFSDEAGNEERHCTRRDGSAVWVNFSVHANLDAHGRFFCYEGTARDVTIQKEAERAREQLEMQLRQAQKLESIGTLAGGVAHEINNPINGIMNYAQLILDDLDEDDQKASFAGEIVHETERIATLVKNLLQFSRHDKQSHSPARVFDIVESTASLIRTVMRHDQITLEIDVPEELPEIKCRSQQIQQVVMNLLTNARDALNEKYEGYHEDKIIRVTAGMTERNGAPGIRLTVEDHGPGIPDEVREHMFEPFYTTKRQEKGTGLGLSIGYSIVNDHHGELQVESEPGEWTRFHVDLPVNNGWRLGEEDEG